MMRAEHAQTHIHSQPLTTQKTVGQSTAARLLMHGQHHISNCTGTQEAASTQAGLHESSLVVDAERNEKGQKTLSLFELCMTES
eukprot:1037049-Karenia_brevis.AAC.1